MPVRFEIYRQGKRLTQFAPSAAYILGPVGTDILPIPGDIFFRDGLLQLARPDAAAMGLGLLWDAGPSGTYVLETTRLKQRDRPYVLNVEVARGRLMHILQKMEEWNLFDYPRTEKLAARFKEAQVILAGALDQQLSDPVAAAAAGDAALAIGMEVAEELTLFHADLLLARRRASGTIARHILGSQVDPLVDNAEYRQSLVAGFDYAVVPLNWREIQPREQDFVTGPLDNLLDFLVTKKMPVVAGPIIDLQESHVPDWMFIWEHDYDTLRDLTYEHVQRIIQRYRRQVSVWNVVAGLHAHTAFTLNFDQTIEFTRLLVGQVKAALPAARTLITIRQAFGEYHARYRSTIPPLMYAEMVSQSGIPFEAFGLELEIGTPTPGGFVRDLFQISSLLDKFASLGRPLFLTAIACPSRNYPDPTDRSDGRLDPASAGRWRRPWDDALQADWVEAVSKLALSKPYVESLAWAYLADVRHGVPGGGLLNSTFKPKASYAKVQGLRELYHAWAKKA
jgi:hypothetical protein